MISCDACIVHPDANQWYCSTSFYFSVMTSITKKLSLLFSWKKKVHWTHFAFSRGELKPLWSSVTHVSVHPCANQLYFTTSIYDVIIRFFLFFKPLVRCLLFLCMCLLIFFALFTIHNDSIVLKIIISTYQIIHITYILYLWNNKNLLCLLINHVWVFFFKNLWIASW